MPIDIHIDVHADVHSDVHMDVHKDVHMDVHIEICRGEYAHQQCKRAAHHPQRSRTSIPKQPCQPPNPCTQIGPTSNARDHATATCKFRYPNNASNGNTMHNQSYTRPVSQHQPAHGQNQPHDNVRTHRTYRQQLRRLWPAAQHGLLKMPSLPTRHNQVTLQPISLNICHTGFNARYNVAAPSARTAKQDERDTVAPHKDLPPHAHGSRHQGTLHAPCNNINAPLSLPEWVRGRDLIPGDGGKLQPPRPYEEFSRRSHPHHP